MWVNQLDLFCFLIWDKGTQENNSDEEGDDELFDHKDEEDGADDELDDVEHVLIVKGATVQRGHRFLHIYDVSHSQTLNGHYTINNHFQKK